MRYEVYTESLPLGLQSSTHTELALGADTAAALVSPPPVLNTPPEALPATIPPARLASASSDPLAWKLALIQEARHAGPVGSSARAEAVRRLASGLTWPCGRRRGKPVSESAIRAWIREYEAGGTTALARKDRADAGRKRVTISKRWDAAADEAGIPADARHLILERVQEAVKREFKGGNSWETVQLNVTPDLVRLSRTAGMDLPPRPLMEVCKLPRDLIERFRPYKAAHIYRKDAGRSAAIQTPRIHRDRSHLRPMEWVAGDVHHIDIAFQRADGSLCTIKAIAWLDLATNRAFVTPVLLRKGEAVRREHVLQSFAAMCLDPNWGVPGTLYLDNGSEYALLDEMTRDLLALTKLVGQAPAIRSAGDLTSGVRKSKPYNPQAKVIETTFAILEKQVLPQLPGHIGGNRMKKKTENQGRAPVPFNGTFADFTEALGQALHYYHRKPQRGHLKGSTPNDRFAAFIAEGWQSVILRREELEIAFSKVETRSVRAGGEFSIGGTLYRADALLSLAGTGRVTVRVPLFGERGYVYVFDDDDRFLCAATEVPVYAFDDPAGAREQQRQAGILRRQMAALGPVPADGQASMQAVVDLTPEPQATPAAIVSINEDFQEAARQAGGLAPTRSPDAQRRRSDQHALIMEKYAARIGASRAVGG